MAVGNDAPVVIRAENEELEQYKQMVERAGQGIWLIDSTATTKFANNALGKIFGVEAAQMPGHKVFEFMDEDAAAVAMEVLGGLANGEEVQGEFRFRHSTGRDVWTRFFATPITNSNGGFDGAFGLFTDITDEVGTRRARSLAESLFQQATESAPIGQALADASGRFTQVNRAYCELTGYSEEELLRKKFGALAHPDELDELNEHVDSLRNGDTDSFSMEKRYIRRSGETVWAQLHVSALRDETGELIAFVAQVININEAKLLRESLEQSNHELRQFTSLASHDLQAPLRTVGGFATVLTQTLTDKLDDRERMYLDQINQGVESMQTLIRDLLAYSRLGRSDINLVPVDLRRVVDKVRSSLQSDIAESNTDLRLHVSSFAVVSGDQQQLTQAIQNLIANSIAYRHPDRQNVIEVRAARFRTEIILSIEDNGIGIPEDQQDRVFEMFHRLNRDDSGSGIGLAIVRRIIDRHNGTIKVTSDAATHTKFTLRLPAA